MVNYNEKLMNKAVMTAGIDIALLLSNTGEKRVLVKPATFTLEKSYFSNQADELCYQLSEKSILGFKKAKVLADMDEQPLLVVKDGSSSDIEILSGTSDKKVLAKIVKGSSYTDAEKYTVTFYNQATEKNETLSMNCATSYRSCGIFYGVEEEGAPMVCRIHEVKTKAFLGTKTKLEIEMASGVDSMFMCAFAICLNELKVKSCIDDISD